MREGPFCSGGEATGMRGGARAHTLATSRGLTRTAEMTAAPAAATARSVNPMARSAGGGGGGGAGSVVVMARKRCDRAWEAAGELIVIVAVGLRGYQKSRRRGEIRDGEEVEAEKFARVDSSREEEAKRPRLPRHAPWR
jgi:hypothetical protein